MSRAVNIRPTGEAGTATADPASIKFSTGERLDRTTIDATMLVNPASTALAKASDAALLRAKLDGVTMEETKVTATTSGASQNVYNGYIACSGENADKFVYSSDHITIFVPLPQGTKRVRFNGRTSNGEVAQGYAFVDTTDFASLVAASAGESPKDISEHIIEKHAFDNTGTAGFKEYVVDVPPGAVCFCALYSGLSLSSSNFYCYLQAGDTVAEMTEKLMNGYDEKITDQIELYDGYVCFGEAKSNYPNDYVCYKDTVGSTVRSGYVGATRVREAKLHGGKIAFRKTGGYDVRVTFTAKAIDRSMTFAELREGGYLSSIHDGRPNPYIAYSPSSNWREIAIPEDCYNIYFTKQYYGGSSNHSNESSRDRRPDAVKIVTERHTYGAVERTNNLIGTLVDDLYGEEATEETDGLEYVNAFKGMNIDNTNNILYTNASSGSVCGFVNVEGCLSVTIGPSSETCYFFIARRKIGNEGTLPDDEVQSGILADGCEGYVKNNGHYMMKMAVGSEAVTIKLTGEAKYVYFQVKYNSSPDVDHTPATLLLTRTERRNGRIDKCHGNHVRLRYKENDRGTLVTDPIWLGAGMYFSVKEPYRIGKGYLVDHVTGRIVNDDFRTLTIKEDTSEEYRRTSTMRMMPAFDVVYEIRRTDGEDIATTDVVVEEFAIVDETYVRKMPEGIAESIYHAFKRKLQTSIGAVWTPLRKVQHSDGGREKRFRKGVTYLGVPYSGPTQWGKHVGIEVSMRTFMTALANPRSVMYTEVLATYTSSDTGNSATATSAYGLTHASYAKEAGAYYGCVCTGLTSYLYGLDHVVKSEYWNTASSSYWGNGVFDIVMRGDVPQGGEAAKIVAGNTQYDYGNKTDRQTLAEMLQPMDFIWRQGHCMVISDIYVDDYGAVKYIVIAEQTTPTSTAGAYTPEFFFLKFFNVVTKSSKPWKVLRRKAAAAWTAEGAAIPRQGMDAELCIMDKSRYTPEETGEIDPDITTFAGEYATFVIGNPDDTTNNFKMYLNIHRGGEGGYTHLQIFGEDADAETDTPIDEDIDISQNGGNVDQPTILAEDIADDWIRFNLAAWWNANHQDTVGKFKARVVRKEEGAVVETSEGFTHFEMIKMDIRLMDGLGFTVKGGVPVICRYEGEDGIIASNDFKVLGTGDYTVSDGVYTGNLTIPSGWSATQNAYVRLFVKTDYGMANMRMRRVSG